MDMLTKGDLTKISEEFGKFFETNMVPQFDKVSGRLDKVENRLEGVENRLDKVEGRLTSVETHLMKVDRKTDEMVVVLREKHVFTPSDIARIDAAQLYPRPTV